MVKKTYFREFICLLHFEQFNFYFFQDSLPSLCPGNILIFVHLIKVEIFA